MEQPENPYRATTEVNSPRHSEASQEKLFRYRTASRRGGYEILFIGVITIVNLGLAFAEVDLFFPVGVVFPALWAQPDAPPVLVDPLVQFVGMGILFSVLGWFASRRNKAAYVTGLILYAGDTLACGMLRDWVALGLHAFFFVLIYGSYKAIDAAAALEAAQDRGTSVS
ncbi:MAG: hypothetical protein H7A21_04820 [Spirochaetales bacterium]|nr:hypothetical protein [Leptospiraceae bacterium]MCP5480736.1 hypothetical protein [Spirochaetales bacterium]MCP5484088.1 hypothetical protein [Spirochaetales bacterium]